LNQDSIDLLRRQLAVLQPLSLVIEDQSHHHAGHAGAGDGGHYDLSIVAEIFAGKNTIARHRLVYDAIGDLRHGKIHAVAIHTRAPGEV
jgi:BolA family transcriptional regulator, general stress-responsive regulator